MKNLFLGMKMGSRTRPDHPRPRKTRKTDRKPRKTRKFGVGGRREAPSIETYVVNISARKSAYVRTKPCLALGLALDWPLVGP